MRNRNTLSISVHCDTTMRHKQIITSQRDLTKRSASFVRAPTVSPRDKLYICSITELCTRWISNSLDQLRTNLITTSKSGTWQDELQTRAGDAGAQQVGILCQPHARQWLIVRREFARNHQPSPHILDMAPKTRASGEGGIVISCADPRVPCDQILGFDNVISIELHTILGEHHSNLFLQIRP